MPSFNYKWAHAQQEQPRSCWSLHIKRHRKLRPVLLWPRCSIQDYIRNWEYFCKKCFMFHLSPDVGLFFFVIFLCVQREEQKAVLYLNAMLQRPRQ